MEGLGVAANVIAVIELSAKIASLCLQYSRAVKNAKSDIERVKKEVDSITSLLQTVDKLLQRPGNTRFSTSENLHAAVKDCLSQLSQLNTKLKPGKRQKAMSSFGVRALKWPFESKGAEKVINDLVRCEQTISLALQVDQAELVLGIHQKIDLAKLPSAEGAAFDSHIDEHDARCLSNTRVDLRRQIAEWAEDAQGRCLFWLNGMAGTGKSTISRTVAQSFAEKGQLGASFFFKRGEGDRGNAARFFTTIAVQLLTKVPSLSPLIGDAVVADPSISGKGLKEQFDKLILQPFSKIQSTTLHASRLVIVVDALDECEREEDVRTILLLLSQFRNVKSICLRVFVTSRPELPIRLGFKKMEGGTYQDLVLHEIHPVTIEHDISVFLQHELAKIRSDRSLAMDWPGQKNIETLVEMAVPLFIFAATVCRFVEDNRWDPKKRLAAILEYKTTSQVSKLDRTYLPILNQLFIGQDETEKEELAREFREVVGTIVVLANPLSIVSLARLLNIPEDDVACRLDLLHSVLNIPTSHARPVRLLHLSFRDFLLDPLKQNKSLFWVDGKETHKKIASKCIQLMATSGHLKKDICALKRPGVLRSEIDSQVVDVYLPAELKYACRYWVYHLEQSDRDIYDEDEIHVFLRTHLLYWLEAMSLLGNASESVIMITTLQTIIKGNKSPDLQTLIYDIKRFILQNRLIIEKMPLQLYCSSLVFAPEKSIVRRQFEKHIPSWMERKSKVEENWNAILQTFEGHSSAVMSVAFSLDGKKVASGSDDKTVRLWDAATGAVQALEGHLRGVTSVAFSPDGKTVTSGSDDETVRLWDAATGAVQTFEGHSDRVRSVAFSLDGKTVASGSDDKTVRLWDAATGAVLQTFEGHSRRVTSVVFSPDGKTVASGSDDKTVRLWDAATGAVQTFEGHSDWVKSVAFSPDGKTVASGSYDKTVRLWDAATGAVQTFEGHSNWVKSVAFSPDGKTVASGSYDKTVRLWDAATGAVLQTLKGHSSRVTSVAFSLDGKTVASGSNDKTVRLWDAATGAVQTFEGHSDRVRSVAFSPDCKTVASGSDDKTVRLWDAATGARLQTFEGHSHWVKSIAFSPDGKTVALGSDDKAVRLWDAATGAVLQTFEGHPDLITSVAFSPDGKTVASGSDDATVRLWDAATGAGLQTFEGHSGQVSLVAFSLDGKTVASGSYDETVRLWDAATGAVLQTFEGHSRGVRLVAFSPNGKTVASGSYDETVRLWDAATGAVLQTFEGYSGSVTSVAFLPDGTIKPSFFVKNNCVVEGETNILWLPPIYRPSCQATWNNFIVLGHPSGKISILKFKEGLKLI